MFTTNLRRSLVSSVVACAVLAGGVVQTASAQRNRRTGGADSVFSLLQKKETAAELKLSDEQQKKIKDLSRTTRLPIEQVKVFLQRKANAKISERPKIDAEMAEATRKQMAKAEADALAVLTPEQKTQFTALRYRTARTSALLFEEVVAKLEIKNDQKKQLEELQKERFAAWTRLTFRERTDKEAVEKFNTGWDEKSLAVLTPTQRDGWQKLVGAAGDSKKPADPRTAATTPPGAKSDGSKTAPTVTRSIRKPVGPYVASFDGSTAAAKGGAKQPTTSYGRGPVNTGEKRFLSFNFENAPWKIVLEYFAGKAGLTLDLTQVPPDTFNYRDSNLYTVTEALDVMNGYLLGKKWLLIRRDKFLVAHNLDNPVPQSIIPDVSESELPRRGRNELMRVTFTLKDDVDVKTTAKELEDMVNPTFGKVLSFDGARRIVVTDIGTNLLRVQKLVSDYDKSTKPEDLSFKAFQCKYIAASDAAKILTEQLDAARIDRNVSGGAASSSGRNSNDPRERLRAMFGGGRGGRDGRGGRGGSPFGGGGFRPTFTPFGTAPTTSTARGTTAAAARQIGNAAVRVTADNRTNNVLVLASARQVKLAEGIIKSIDVPVEGTPTNIGNSDANRPYFKVYPVTRVDAADATRTLSALMPDVVINQTGNSVTVANTNPRSRFGTTTTSIPKGGWIHIMGTADQHKVVAELIREMDGPTGSVATKTIKLKTVDPTTAGQLLVSVFQNDGTSAPSINVVAQSRIVVIRGTEDQIATAEKVLKDWEDQTKPTFTVQTGNTRVFPVPDAEALAPLLQQLSGNKIRIIVPGKSTSPVRNRLTPNGGGSEPRVPANGRRTTDRNDRPLWRDFYRRTTHIPRISSDDALAMATPDEQRPQNSRGAFSTTPVAAQDDNGKSGDSTAAQTEPAVKLMIVNGQIVITSDNKEELDRVQQLIEKLVPMIPARTTWTVFYLQAADCTDAATMLEQLYPSSSVSTATTANSGGMFGGITGGVTQFANTLGNMSGLNSLGAADTLRIIPEPRSNALFVSGPSSKVRDVEQMLKVLDATDLPGTLRERVPRMIPVRYADVNEVANIIREVYKDFMQPAGGAAANQLNPLAMLMGGNQGRSSRGGRGGRNGNSGGRQQPVQLTLGVDDRTGQLVVSANDTLYNQIEEMVYRLDESAYKANRTTRVIRLENAQPSAVTQALTAMYPNISVSVTSNRPGTAGTPGTQTSPLGTSGFSTNPAARALMFQQMMQRGQQGQGNDGGRGSFGGPRFTPFGGGNSPFGGGNTRGGGTPSFGGSRGGRGGRR